MVVPPIAIYGAIATSKALAQELYSIIEDAYKFEKDLKNLRDIFVHSKMIFDVMTEALEEISDDLKPELADYIASMTGELDGKFTEAKAKLEKYVRVQWHFVKNAMTLAIGALSEWVSRFLQLCGMLPYKLQKTFQDKMVSDKFKAETDGPLAALNAHIQIKKAQLDFEKEDIEATLATMKDEPPAHQKHDVRSYRYRKELIRIPDHIQNDEEKLRSFKLEVARLTAVLRAANPALTHLPKAYCWFQRRVIGDPTPEVLGIAYEVYENMVTSQISLKEVIEMGAPQHSLSDRMKLTQEFVSAMAYLRGLHWVHKAIRSSNVLLCYTRNDRSAPENLGHVNLIGFSVTRRGTGELASTGGDNERDWQYQVYCHPDRQMINIMEDDIIAAGERHSGGGLLASSSAHSPSETRVLNTASASLAVVATVSPTSSTLPYYRYMHDVYSIGVVLLEIGLWRDLTPFNSPLRTALPEERKRLLLQMTQNELPRAVGEKYASIVKKCLEADDKGPAVAEVLSNLAQIQI